MYGGNTVANYVQRWMSNIEQYMAVAIYSWKQDSVSDIFFEKYANCQ
jgi:hypothetical protein